MLKMTRLAALAAVLLVAVSAAVVPQAGTRRPPGGRPPPRRPTAAAAPAGVRAEGIGESRPKSSTTRTASTRCWKGSDIVAKVTLAILVIMSIGSWYIIITKVYEQAKMGKHARAADKTFWRAPSVQEGAAGLKKSSPFRFIAETGIEATSKHVGLLEKVDMNEWITMSIQRADRQRAKPHAGWPRLPGHRRLDGAVRRAVRHGLGHLSRAHRHRHRRAGVDRQGRGAGRRGADHDRDRPRGRRAGGARLQLARPPQQDRDGLRPQLRRRPARRAALHRPEVPDRS